MKFPTPLLIKISCILTLCFTSLIYDCYADYYDNNAVPDFTSDMGDAIYGNKNFEVKYSYHDGIITFHVIYHEKDGGGGIADAWAEKIKIQYNLNSESSSAPKHTILDINKCPNNFNPITYEYLAVAAPGGTKYYGIIKASQFESAGSAPLVWQIAPRDGLHDVYIMNLSISSIPTSWFGETIKFYIYEEWERDEDGKPAEIVSNYSVPVTITFPSLDLTTISHTSTLNTCNNNINIDFTTPSDFNEPIISGFSETAIAQTNARLAYQVKYREAGNSTWNNLTAKVDCNPNTSINVKHDGQKGVEYEYQLHYGFTLRNTDQFWDTDDEIFRGSKVANPSTPTIDSLIPGCDEATLYFSANNLETIDHYKIEKISIDNNVSTPIILTQTVVDDLEPTTSSYTFPQTDNTYPLVAVYALNSCGDEKYDFDSIKTLDPPTFTPQIENIIQLNDGAFISWSIDQNEPTQEYSHFELYRKKDTDLDFVLIEENLPFDTLSYFDPDVNTCSRNDYKIALVNDCGSTMSANDFIVLTSDFKEVINPDKTTASTGYFNNRIEIKWAYFPGFKDAVEGLEILRKKPDDATFSQVKYIEDNQTTSWNDMDAEANEIYQYRLVAHGTCYGPQTSDSIEVVGFRLKTGMVTGNISFDGGNPVENVEVKISQGTSTSSSLIFNNSEKDYLLLKDTMLFTTFNEFTIETWVYSEQWNSINTAQNIIANRNIRFLLYNGKLVLRKFNSDGTSTVDNTSYSADYMSLNPERISWQHVAVIYSSDSIKLCFNNKIIGRFENADPDLFSFDRLNTFIGARPKTPSNAADYTTIDFNIPENDNFFNGNLDELRIWNIARTEDEIIRDCNRIISGDEIGLVSYLRFDEGFGDYAYDRSKTGDDYNKNDAKIEGAEWTTHTPNHEKLHASGITNQYGNYLISGIPFSGTGEIFTVTPFKPAHVFSPNQKPLFIGDDQLVHNDVNFIDQSSFEVDIEVVYPHASDHPVKDVFVKIDGNYVMGADNQPLVTDEHGQVSINVPIGDHIISVEKNNHVFESAYWPPKNEDILITYYFDQDFPEPIVFNDITTVRLAGKVVGGAIEKEKQLYSNLNPGNNNIGTANLTLSLTSGRPLNGFNIDTIISTDPSTGQYFLDLIPEKFEIKSVLTSNNNQFINPTSGNVVADLSNKFYPYTTIDSLDNGMVDTAFIYNHEQSFYLPVVPTFSITNSDGNVVFGDSLISITIDDETVDLPIYSKIGDNYVYNFGYPIFRMAQTYDMVFSAYQQFENHDDPLHVVIDRVPVSNGKFIIDNDVSGVQTVLDADEDGVADYEFTAGYPMIASPYLVTIRTKLEADETTYDSSEPVGPIEAYILGTRSTGNNFITNGPDMVKYILRDPYGSGSYATLSEGTTIENFINQKVDIGTEFNTNIVTNTGFNMWYAGGMPPLMKITQANVYSNSTVTVKTNAYLGEETHESTSTTLTSSISTSSSPGFIGSEGDIFYGLSTNMIFGENRDILITKEPKTSQYDIIIDSTQFNGDYYYLKRKNKIGVGSVFDTEFVYSQKHIKNTLIPNLVYLRNKLLTDNPKYESLLNESDPDYGKCNDDPCFGADTVLLVGDFDGRKGYYGRSYIYFSDSVSYISDDGEMVTFDDLHNDSVYYLNKQIESWEECLMQNELQKFISVPDENHKNISFDAGSSYSSSITTSESKTISGSFSFLIGVNFTIRSGVTLDNAGVKIGVTNNTFVNTSVSGGQTTSSSTTAGFTLSDPDFNNYYTMDVKKCLYGNGPVFSTKGGQSSCPYEGEELTEYFMPGDIVLSNATVQMELPSLSVNTNYQSGIPEDIPATFELHLANMSESNSDTWYTIWVDPASISNNAELKMDGAVLVNGLDIKVPANETLTKTLSFYKGDANVFSYDSVRVVMKSRCDVNVYDEQYLSVKFEPSCSPVDLVNIPEEWVLNIENNDTIEMIAGDYNLSNSNLKSVSLQYKQPGVLNPTNIVNFYTDSSDYNQDNGNKKMLDASTTSWLAGFEGMPDGIYDLRAIATCNNASEDYYYTSPYLRGTIDRLAPHLFGAAQPADGILSPNDEILAKFNETIDAGDLYMNNKYITVKGVKNGTDLSTSPNILHNSCVQFDGSAQHLIIPQGVNLKYTSFSIEFWAKRNRLGKECLFSQANPGSSGLWMGFDENDKFTVVFNTDTLKTDRSFNDIIDKWGHFSFVFNIDEAIENAMINAVTAPGAEKKLRTVSTDYYETSPVIVGNSIQLNEGFEGQMHGLRIWNAPRSSDDLNAFSSIVLNGYETGLLGYWPMDDAKGILARDLAFARHAEMNATWQVNNEGKALKLGGADHFEFDAGTMVFSDQTNFTLEFWFKGESPADTAYLFGNGLADGTDGFTSCWAICADYNEHFYIKNNGTNFSFSGSGYFDNQWHHLALTVNRRGNLNTYLDGELKYTTSAIGTTGLGGAKCYLGVGYVPLDNANPFQFNFIGGIDEVRVWNAALPAKTIEQNMYFTLKGDEPGLKAYFPFEDVNQTNLLLTNASPDNFSQATLLQAGNGMVNHDSIYSEITPSLKLSPPKSSIDFTYSINNDELIITPTEELYKIENINLEISVERVKDMFGNHMASTEIWNAFVDKNQLVWDKQSITLLKETETDLSFNMLIHNKGGQVEPYSIINLPAWLTAEPSSGFLDPLQSTEITFTINPAINTGNYTYDIYLNGSTNYNERLGINLTVKAKEPSWNVDPKGFEHSLTLIGRIKIGENYSTDVNDKVGAFAENECRGAANLQYLMEFGIYLVNMTIYGNSNGETINLKIWDASEGNVLGDVAPTLIFEDDAILGRPEDPVIIYSAGEIAGEISLAEGWSWVSFNLTDPNLADINLFLDDDVINNNIIIKNNGPFAVPDGNNMIGSLKGFNLSEMYMFNMSDPVILDYSGLPVNTNTQIIKMGKEWNFIGFTPQIKIPVGEAFSYFTPQANDLVKSQQQFAMYSNIMGWVGSLDHLEPGKGYKYYSCNPDSFEFIYPRESSLKSWDTYEVENPFKIDLHRWPENLSVIAVIVDQNGQRINDLSLIGDHEDDIRGFATASQNASGKLFLTLHGESGDCIRLSVMNENNDRVQLSNEIIFEPDDIIGSVNHPYKIVINSEQLSALQISDENYGLTCYPNPFTNNITFQLNSPNKDEVVNFQIYGIDGKRYRKWEGKNHTIIWDGCDEQNNEIPGGIYLIKATASKRVMNQMVIKK